MNEPIHFCPVGDRRRPVAVLFSLDGTLVDHDGAVSGALDELYATRAPQIERSEDDFRQSWKKASSSPGDGRGQGGIAWERARVRTAFGRPDLDADTADQIFAEFLQGYELRWTFFPDAIPCLERLRGKPLAIVTNGNPRQQRRKLRKLGLREHFKEILISEELGSAKPSPDILLEASRRLWSLPGECILVGGSWEDDVEGGRRAGMQPVWLDRVGNDFQTDIPVVSGLSQLPDLVSRWQAAKPEELPTFDFQN
jgi:putative hydrolase of the HAD superfamily